MTIELTHLTCGGVIVIYTGKDEGSASKRAWVKAEVLGYTDAPTLLSIAETEERIQKVND